MKNDAKNTDEYLQLLPQWQVTKLSEFRNLIHEVAPNTTEAIKWGVPVFMYEAKVVFTMASFKSHVKYNFIANGAQLYDPTGLFNNGLESAKSRSIDLTENQTVDSGVLKDLIKQALATL